MCKTENTINNSYSQHFFCLFKCLRPGHAFATEMLHDGNPKPSTLHQLPAHPIWWGIERVLWCWHHKWGCSFTANGSIYWKEPAKAQSLHFRGSAQPEDLSTCAQISSKALINIKFPKENNVVLKMVSLHWNGIEILEFDKQGHIIDKRLIHSE